MLSKTVTLVMEDSNGQPSALGSGVVIAPNIVATNWHVIQQSARGLVRVVGSEQKYDIAGIVAFDHSKDLALLCVPKIQVTSIEMGDSEVLQIGDQVFAAGSPRGLDGTFSNGIVSGVRKIRDEYKLLQITAPISAGSSGGPVVDGRGMLIGIAVSTFRDGQNLNFAVPSLYVKELMGRIGGIVELAKATPHKAASENLDRPPTAAITGRGFMFDSPCCPTCGGWYSYSLANSGRSSASKIVYQIIFYDKTNAPIESQQFIYRDAVPAGLARRVTGQAHTSVHALILNATNGCNNPVGRFVEIRILDFTVSD